MANRIHLVPVKGRVGEGSTRGGAGTTLGAGARGISCAAFIWTVFIRAGLISAGVVGAGCAPAGAAAMAATPTTAWAKARAKADRRAEVFIAVDVVFPVMILQKMQK